MFLVWSQRKPHAHMPIEVWKWVWKTLTRIHTHTQVRTWQPFPCVFTEYAIYLIIILLSLRACVPPTPSTVRVHINNALARLVSHKSRLRTHNRTIPLRYWAAGGNVGEILWYIFITQIPFARTEPLLCASKLKYNISTRAKHAPNRQTPADNADNTGLCNYNLARNSSPAKERENAREQRKGQQWNPLHICGHANFLNFHFGFVPAQQDTTITTTTSSQTSHVATVSPSCVGSFSARAHTLVSVWSRYFN